MKRDGYYEVAGIDLRAEAERLRRLDVFASGKLATTAPGIKVRRARRRPSRLGFAVPAEWRISITAYPGIRAGDALEVLLHELVHLHVGAQPGRRRWHGRVFTRTLAVAMAQAYGVSVAAVRPSIHGAYAEAIERRRAEDASRAARADRAAQAAQAARSDGPDSGEQLALALGA